MSYSGWWIVLGDTRIKVESWEQLVATCRLFNLTLPDDEDDLELGS
jgi:hypothetical protein